jgi:hypothetical protein
MDNVAPYRENAAGGVAGDKLHDDHNRDMLQPTILISSLLNEIGIQIKYSRLSSSMPLHIPLSPQP